MERQISRRKKRSLFGTPRFELILELSLSDEEFETARKLGRLGAILYASLDLEMRPGEDDFGWLWRFAVGSCTGQVIRIEDALKGVAIRASRLSDALEIEDALRRATDLLQLEIAATLGFDADELADLGAEPKPAPDFFISEKS